MEKTSRELSGINHLNLVTTSAHPAGLRVPEQLGTERPRRRPARLSARAFQATRGETFYSLLLGMIPH